MQQPGFEIDYSQTPRRTWDFEDYIAIVRRNLGWILGPAFAVLVVTVVGAFLWPDQYTSTATIRVVPPAVPTTLVQSNINMQMSDRVNAMYQTISSRDNLANIITSFNLYPNERKGRPIEDLAETMRNKIRISPVTSVTQGSDREPIAAFRVSFQYPDRSIARRVTDDLVGRFMSESARDRNRRSTQTTQFLRDETEKARRMIQEADAKIAEYQQAYQGRLPEQIQFNLTQLSSLERRAESLQSSIAQSNQQELILESDLRTLRSQLASLTPIAAAAATEARAANEDLVRLNKEIEQWEVLLAQYRQRYSDLYPDVQQLIGRLAVARQRRDKMMTEQSKEEAQETKAAAPRLDPMFERERRNLNAAITKVESQMKVLGLRKADIQQELAKTEKQITGLHARIDATPVSSQHYVQLIRERELAALKYEDLKKREQTSVLAESLELRQQGEVLEVLEQASTPLEPTSPKRELVIPAGLGGGLILGIALAGLRELRNSSIRSLKDVRVYTQLPILGCVPLIEDDAHVSARRRIMIIGWLTALLAGLAVMGGAVMYYYSTHA
jgi:polysaccharide chain length determinant protein (PEP-CTERM system associated)